MKRVSFKVAKAIKDAGYPQIDKDRGYVVSNNIKWWKYDDSSYSDSATVNGVKIAENNIIGLLVEDIPWQDRGYGCKYYTYETIAAPTYLEVWLWLWREKKYCIGVLFDDGNCAVEIWQNKSFMRDFEEKFDPEEAIIATIEYLVENNLIK